MPAKLTIQEKVKNRKKRQLMRLSRSASRMIVMHDINNRRIPVDVAWSGYKHYIKELPIIVQQLLDEKIAPIYIPRKAMNIYMTD